MLVGLLLKEELKEERGANGAVIGILRAVVVVDVGDAVVVVVVVAAAAAAAVVVAVVVVPVFVVPVFDGDVLGGGNGRLWSWTRTCSPSTTPLTTAARESPGIAFFCDICRPLSSKQSPC